jgi:hypothetical protein
MLRYSGPRVVIHRGPFDRFFNQETGEVGRYLKVRGKLVESAAKRQVGVRTGALRASIHMRHSRDPRGQYVTVGSSLPYALMHHQGTRPHMIFPNGPHKLVFMSRGRLIFANAVAHPGTKANRYLSDNLRLVF